MSGTSAYNDNASQAKNGGKLLEAAAGQTTATGDFVGIKFINDTVIDSITAHSSFENFSDIEDTITVSAGDYLPVKFTAITITSGVCFCVNR